jgi:hypothetical protein
MKYLIYCCIILCVFVGCTPSYYEAKRGYYEAKNGYYEAQKEAYKAYTEAAKQPIASFTTKEGVTVTVNNTNILTPSIIQERNAFVEGLKVVVDSTPAALLSGGWAGREILKQTTGDSSTTTTTNTTEDNSSVDKSSTNTTEDNSSKTSTEDNSSTATPTIVTQPEPKIIIGE